jgi:hypothetical protein
MAANSAPIFSRGGALGFARINAVNIKSDGSGTIGTDIFKAFSADTSNGGFVQKVRISLCATAAGTAASFGGGVVRAYISTVSSGATTSADTHLWAEVGIPGFTVDGDAGNNPIPSFEISFGVALEPGQHVHVSLGAASLVANCELKAVVVAGKY